MKQLLKIIFLFPLVLILAGCGPSGHNSDPALFTAALWNVQTLFDGEETGGEFPDFRAAAGWAPEKYQARLSALSQAFLSMPELPDFIGLIEIENPRVLEDFSLRLKSDLSDKLKSTPSNGYNWTAFASLPGSAMGIGFLSRFPLVEVRAHSITIGQEESFNTAPRPVLEARVEIRGEALVFLLCHWKSKLGGADASEALRRASARVVYRRLSEIKESEGGTPVIVMGDFNLNHDDFYRRSLAFCALLPDDSDAALLAAQTSPPDFLVLSSEKPPRSFYFNEEIITLYSPWGEEMTGGSYFFRGGWETIDGFLLSEGLFSGVGWDFAGSILLDSEPFISSNGVPNAYISRYGRGLSDHLPILLYLRYAE